MSGGSGGTTTTKQDSGPPDFQRDYLERAFAEASDLYSNYKTSGQGVIQDFTPEEKAAQAGSVNYANTTARDIVDRTNKAHQFALGDVLSPDSNPYLAQYAQAAARPITDQLLTEALPELRTGFVGQGGYGGTRQDLAQQSALDKTARTIADQSAGIYNQAYNRGLQTFETGLALSPEVMNLGLRPEEILAGVGAQKRSLTQSQALEPYLMLQQFIDSISGNYGGEGTSESKSPETFWQRIGLGNLF